MFPEIMVVPMREDLTRIGFRELRTPADVDAALKNEKRTTLVVVNSVCGCAAGKARPAIAKALRHAARPEVLTTVFAGQDPEATAQARSYFTNYAPSSPSVALMRDGKVRRSRLGVSGQTVPIDTRVRRFHGLVIGSGALVAGVEPDGPAARGDLQVGDVIVALDGEPVSGVDALHRLLTEERVGQEVSLAVLRRATIRQIVVTAGEG